MLITKMEFATIEEANAFIAGVDCLSDMVLDYGQVSIETDIQTISGKVTVLVTSSNEDDDEGEDEE